MDDTPFYAAKDLQSLGIECGSNVRVHRSALFFGAHKIALGSNVRIDAHVIITAGEPVRIGRFVHLGAGAYIFGRAGVTMADFTGLSPRATLLTTSDISDEGYLTNPTVPEEYRRVQSAPVVMEKHAVVGCGSVVLPGVCLAEGAAIGALSVVSSNVPAFAIVAGNPPRKVGTRNEKRLREMEARLLAAQHG